MKKGRNSHMKQRRLVILIATILPLIYVTTVSAGIAIQRPNKTYGVFVGINKYRESDISLRFCVIDASSLYDQLNNKSSENYLLTDEKATKENILGKIGQIINTVKKNDFVILYLAAHGIIQYNDYFIFASDSTHKNVLGTCIPSRTIINALSSKKMTGVNVLIIIDTCHAGGIGFDISDFYDPINKSGCAMMLSSSPLEVAHEGFEYGGGHGVFTHYLVQGLKGNADYNKDNAITVRELFDYTYFNVKKATKDSQNPVLIGTLPNSLVVKTIRFKR